MTEQDPADLATYDHAEPVPDPATDAVALTGNAQVDAVIASLEALPDLPVDQHVAVFEAAHVGLRDALSGAGGPAQG